MAQRSKNCHAPSEQFFGHRKSASKGFAFVRNKFESCPRNHHRTQHLIQCCVLFFALKPLYFKGFHNTFNLCPVQKGLFFCLKIAANSFDLNAVCTPCENSFITNFCMVELWLVRLVVGCFFYSPFLLIFQFALKGVLHEFQLDRLSFHPLAFRE